MEPDEPLTEREILARELDACRNRCLDIERRAEKVAWHIGECLKRLKYTEEGSCNVVASMAWRPIVSAPRDGTRILARTGRFVNIERRDDGLGWTDEEARDLEHPEYWMPLPELHDSLP
jgi:hypothetical protein